MNGLAMTIRVGGKLSMWALAAAMVAAPAVGQVTAPVVPPLPAPGMQPIQTVPLPPAPGVVVEPAPLPPAIWDPASVAQLVAAIQGIEADGLNPADYDLPGLEAAMATNDPLAISAAATRRFDLLSN